MCGVRVSLFFFYFGDAMAISFSVVIIVRTLDLIGLLDFGIGSLLMRLRRGWEYLRY